MRIAVPVNEDQKTVCESFGRGPYFALLEEASGKLMYEDNSAISSQGGAGIKAAQVLVDRVVKALLTQCGRGAGCGRHRPL